MLDWKKEGQYVDNDFTTKKIDDWNECTMIRTRRTVSAVLHGIPFSLLVCVFPGVAQIFVLDAVGLGVNIVGRCKACSICMSQPDTTCKTRAMTQHVYDTAWLPPVNIVRV